MKLKITLITLCAIALFSCKKDKVDPKPFTSFSAAADGIYVCNEGGFLAGNSTITYTNGTDAETIQDVFRIANDENLGDVGNSITKIGSKIYIVVNNSSKVVEVEASSMKKSATITGFTSPRFLIEATSGKAYVSDLYSNNISIVDLATHSITGTIALTGSSEEMLLYNGKVYVTNLSTSYLYVIDPVNDAIEDSVLIGPGGNSLERDANNKLWILCGGDFNTGAPGSLHRVDPVTKSVELSFTFTPSEYPTRLTTNETGTEIFFLNGNVYKMLLTDLSLPATPYIDANGKSFYGMDYDKVSQVLYVSDAVDYQQAGRMYRYDSAGNLINSLPAGIIPGGFLFLNN